MSLVLLSGVHHEAKLLNFLLDPLIGKYMRLILLYTFFRV